jgi:phage gpG-like protein
MSDITINVEVDTRAVDRAIDEMLRAGRNLGPAFRQAKPIMRADQREHAKRKEGPDGRWPARAPASRSYSKGKRRRTRKLLGKLPIATTYAATSTGIRAYSRVPWSGVHQYGGRVGRGANVPARPFLWISDSLLAKVTAIFSSHVIGGR